MGDCNGDWSEFLCILMEYDAKVIVFSQIKHKRILLYNCQLVTG